MIWILRKMNIFMLDDMYICMYIYMWDDSIKNINWIWLQEICEEMVGTYLITGWDKRIRFSLCIWWLNFVFVSLFVRKRLKGSHVVGVQIGDLYRTYIECSHILVYIYLLNLCFTIYNKDYLSLYAFRK